MHLVNDAVDKSEESRVLGDKEALDPRVKQAQRHAEIPTEPRRDERRSPELSAEDLFEQLLAELIYSTASEFVSCEKFVLFQMQNIVIGSAEAAVTNGNGRERDDPAYDLVTRTYHHMIRERQEKRYVIKTCLTSSSAILLKLALRPVEIFKSQITKMSYVLCVCLC